MIWTIVKSEFKNMFRDRMYFLFAIYPVLLGLIGYYILPELPGGVVQDIVPMVLIVMSGFVYGALIAFTLLDDKDDNVLMSLKITPINVKAYVGVKLVVGFMFGLIATVVLIYTTGFLKEADPSIWVILVISILGALQAPIIALLVNSFSDNKVEGFVIMKLSGLILFLPIIGYFITGIVQYALGIAPGFWSSRVIETQIGLDTAGNILIIFIIGIAYNIFVTYLFMKLYSKKANL